MKDKFENAIAELIYYYYLLLLLLLLLVKQRELTRFGSTAPPYLLFRVEQERKSLFNEKDNSNMEMLALLSTFNQPDWTDRGIFFFSFVLLDNFLIVDSWKFTKLECDIHVSGLYCHHIAPLSPYPLPSVLIIPIDDMDTCSTMHARMYSQLYTDVHQRRRRMHAKMHQLTLTLVESVYFRKGFPMFHCFFFMSV